MIGEMVAENQLFFSVACTMNDAPCIAAMRWFRDQIFFSRDYSDIPKQLLEYSEDKNMLKAISDYAKAADFGIQDMQFEFDSKELKDDTALPLKSANWNKGGVGAVYARLVGKLRCRRSALENGCRQCKGKPSG